MEDMTRKLGKVYLNDNYEVAGALSDALIDRGY